MPMSEVVYSHASDEWETPQALFDEYDNIYHFDVDVCASHENAKCKRFYSKEEDGLAQGWGGAAWCNPPYSQVKKWVRKAHEEVQSGRCKTVVMLLPSRTDTRWFHEYIYGTYRVEFVKGRLKFNNSKYNAPFPSMVVIMTKQKE